MNSMNRLNFKINIYSFLIIIIIIMFSHSYSFAQYDDIIERIDIDYQKGLITLDEALLYKVYAIEGSPEEFNEIPEKYKEGKWGVATFPMIIFEDVESNWHLLNEETKKKLAPHMIKPGETMRKIFTPFGEEVLFFLYSPFIYLEVIEINTDDTEKQNKVLFKPEMYKMLRCNDCDFKLHTSVRVLVDHRIKFCGRRNLPIIFLFTFQVEKLPQVMNISKEMPCHPIDKDFSSYPNYEKIFSEVYLKRFGLVKDLKVTEIFEDGSVLLNYGMKEIKLKPGEECEFIKSIEKYNLMKYINKIIIKNYGYQHVYIKKEKCLKYE